MIQLSGPGLFQWDTGRMVELTDSTATHVHFANPGDALAPILPVSSGKVKIPDYLLQTGKTLLVYAVANGITLEQRSFFVTKRERPENYVYEDDQRNYIYTLIQNAEAAIQAAEGVAKDLRDAKDRGEFNGPPGADPTEEQIQAAVEQYFEEHPASGGGGFSPVITVQPIDGGSRIFITDITGTKSVDVLNGTDGFSPSVGVTQIPGGYQLDIQNRDSLKIVRIMNGTDGDDGEPGKSAYQYAKDGGYTGTEAQFAAKLAAEYPTKVSQLINDSGYITDYTETDPTVPAWAKASTKPSYSKSEVGLENVDNVKQYSAFNPPPYPVTSVNGNTGAITLDASDVGARPYTWTPTYSDVGADKSGAAASAVSGHNTSDEAHNDIRLLITGLATRLDALANSDDNTLDQMAEIVAYIKDNRDLIDQITTGKVSVADIVNNLTTNVSNKPLSAAQGVALKKLIDAITVPTKVSQLDNDKGYLTEHQDISGKLDASLLPTAINTALAQAKASGDFDGEDGTSVTVKSVSESTADGGSNVVTFSDGKTLTVKNGNKGTDGYTPVKGKDYFDGNTPVKGTDYWTEADQESIVQQVITALGTPVFGRVDADNNIILTGELADGEYTIKYENAEGEQTVIGTLEQGGIDNLANPNSSEWLVNKRLNSSAAVVDAFQGATGGAVTNFIPCKTGDVIRVKGLDVSYYYSNNTGDKGRATAFFFAEDKTTAIAKNVPADGNGWVYENGIWTYTVGTSLTAVSGSNSDIRYARLTGLFYSGYTKDDVIITVNEEIV